MPIYTLQLSMLVEENNIGQCQYTDAMRIWHYTVLSLLFSRLLTLC